jgi:trehalose 6-phosphate synthase/phosphatase
MLGLEHITSRGSLMLEYYGRNVGVKIMPTGVKPERFLSGFSWEETMWRRGELLADVSLSFLDLKPGFTW